MKDRILKKIKESQGDYVSGQYLGRELGISRTAVWKHIKGLKEDGYIIESSSKKGYRLGPIPDIITPQELQEGLDTRVIGREIYYLPTVDSTNNYAKELARSGCGDGTVIIADQQTQGRGRMGRSWHSADKRGIWMSIILRPPVGLGDIQIITLAASLAVALAVDEIFDIKVGIKWPNDIVLGGKKICGILTEMSMEMEQVDFLVLGIGLNFKQQGSDFPKEIDDRATSLGVYLKKTYNLDIGNIKRGQLIRPILSRLEDVYAKVNKGAVTDIIREWKDYSITLGKEVYVNFRGKQYKGIALDVDADGRLVVECEDGITRKILSGEVSVRGILGYT